MIIIGYQGIGKSTLSNKDLKYIDLESSGFWIDGKRDENWYIPYCQIAEHLSQQGYSVFVSSHEVVRNFLVNSKEDIYCCVPNVLLKNEWIEKLKERYNQSELEKDYKAYMNALDRYDENVQEISNTSRNISVIFIDYMNYDLKEIIENYIKVSK